MRLSFNIRLNTIMPMSLVYTHHPSAGVSKNLITFGRYEYPQALTFLQPWMGEDNSGLALFWEILSMSLKLPDLCPYLTHMIHGHDPGEEGISSERNSWTELRKQSWNDPHGGQGTMGVVKKYLSLSKTLTVWEVYLKGKKLTKHNKIQTHTYTHKPKWKKRSKKLKIVDLWHARLGDQDLKNQILSKFVGFF